MSFYLRKLNRSEFLAAEANVWGKHCHSISIGKSHFHLFSVVKETTAIQPPPVITEEGDESAKFNKQHFWWFW